MAIESGTNALISIGGTTVNGTTGQSISQTVNAIETTTKDSDGIKTFMAGEIEGEGTIEGRADKTLTYGIEELRTAKAAKASVNIIFGPGVHTGGERTLSFAAIITSLSETQNEDASITWSCGYKITGAVTDGTSATTV